MWNGKFYIFAGCDGLNDLNDCHVLDLSTMMWRDITHQSGQYHAFMLVGDKIITFGGWRGADPLGLNAINYLETQTLAWESSEASGDSPPGVLYGYGVVAVGASLVVFGGWDGRNATNNTYILDCASLFQ